MPLSKDPIGNSVSASGSSRASRCMEPDSCIDALNKVKARLGKLPPPAPCGDAVIDAKRLRSLLRIAGKRPRQGQIHAFRDAVEIALTQYVTDIGNERNQIKPGALLADLGKIETAARQLADLLTNSREAEDAMVRAVRPWQFAPAPLHVGPFAGLVFEAVALKASNAARAARQLDFGAIPYVRVGRGRHAVNGLIKALIIAWDACFEVPATFLGGETRSAFVALTQACLAQIGAPMQSSEALAKTCTRIAKTVRGTAATS